MVEGTVGQDAYWRRKFNVSDVDGNGVTAVEDDRGKECPGCKEIMFSPVARDDQARSPSLGPHLPSVQQLAK